MGRHRIRTTFTPGEVLYVGDAELLDLQRQGLILDEEKAAKLDEADAAAKAEAESTDAAATAAPSKKTKGA